MPREDRCIIFDYAETYKAMYTLCVQKGLPQPFVGSITALNFKTGDDKSVVVRFANGLQGMSATREFSRDFLAAALMLYCGTCNIPIPKRATKPVELGGEAVTLRITL
jgi:hypothetical protein